MPLQPNEQQLLRWAVWGSSRVQGLCETLRGGPPLPAASAEPRWQARPSGPYIHMIEPCAGPLVWNYKYVRVCEKIALTCRKRICITLMVVCFVTGERKHAGKLANEHNGKPFEKLWLVDIWHFGSIFFFYKRFILLVLNFLDFTSGIWTFLWKVSWRMNKRAF